MRQLAVKNQTNGPLTFRKPRTAGPLSLLSRQISPHPLSGPILQTNSACACGGGCPRCHSKLPIQTKLAVSQPGDVYEQEADRVAEQVMRMPAPALQRTCASCSSGGSTCPECEAEKESLVQRRAEHVSETGGSVPDSFLHDLGPGQPLDTATRDFVEPRFGHDFSNVRVYTDRRAAESAQAVNALAYTVGHNVVFGQGQYAPETTVGKRLLAHELTHMLQQTGSSPTDGSIQRKPDEGKDLPANPPAPKPASSCPTFVSLTATINTPKVSDSCKGPKCRLELGCCTTPRDTCGSTKDSGAAFKGTIDVPAGCTGELGFMQNLVSSDRKRTLTDKSNECVAITSPLADGGVPWKGCKISVTTAGPQTIESDDCPNVLLLDNMTAASVKDSFKTFLIWKVTGGKGWKTIGMVSWSWSASTVQKKGADCASKWTAPGGSSSTLTGTASTEVPVAKPSAQDVKDKWGPCEKKE